MGARKIEFFFFFFKVGTAMNDKTSRQTTFFNPEIKSSSIIFFTLESNFDDVVSESVSNVIYYL